MIYVMSDLHGKYDAYQKMLERIRFTEEDSLFILGDICDRGEQPMEILVDMMGRSNIYPVMGNHDSIAAYLLRYLSVEITKENYDTHINEQIIRILLLWQSEGGSTTIDGFKRLSRTQQREILEYLDSFPLYESVEVGDKIYIMTHAGLGGYRPDKKLREYTREELFETRDILDGAPFDEENCYLITGHTPTFVYTGKPEIIREGHQIRIDCGAVFDGGRLACLCLDNDEVYYV